MEAGKDIHLTGATLEALGDNGSLILKAGNNIHLDRKPWSLEIPYETGGDVRPMFPDLVVVRKSGSEFVIDILEPHDPSLSDNFEKAVGLAKFAEKHGGLFGRIQLIRKQSSAGGEHFARLEINQAATIKKLLLITSNPQLDELFSAQPK